MRWPLNCSSELPDEERRKIMSSDAPGPQPVFQSQDQPGNLIISIRPRGEEMWEGRVGKVNTWAFWRASLADRIIYTLFLDCTSTRGLMLSNCGAGEDSRVPWTARKSNQSIVKEILNIHWKDWCWRSNTMATWCGELTHWKRPWCWEGLGVGVEGDDRGWDGWMASLTQYTWVWVNSESWWWTGRPGVLWFMGLQRVGHDWATELNWLTC